jgi:hypothetical protein
MVDEINDWLKAEFWPVEGKGIKVGGEWIVGEGKGLDNRKGALWYVLWHLILKFRFADFLSF